LISRSIPPYSVVAGNPARIVKQYDFSSGKWVLGCIRPAATADQQAPMHVATAPSGETFLEASPEDGTPLILPLAEK
jgi:hypothetical protein